MKKTLLTCLLALLLIPVFGQLMYVERFEVPTLFSEKNFMVMTRPGGLIAFRAQPEKGLNLRSKLQYFLTDYELKSQSIKEIGIKDNYDLIGYDLEGDFFYALLQKGTTATSERYIIEIDLRSEIAKEIPIENIYSMELKEFFVLERHAVFMGTADLRPVVQILDIEANNVYTVQGIYSKDTKILQLRKDAELGIMDILVSKRDMYKMKQVSILTFDALGNKIRDVVIDKLVDPDLELVEGTLTPIHNYQQSLIGAYGHRKREAFYGIYMADINEFGEFKVNYYSLEDFPNFYNYLNDKQKVKKQKELERYYEKGKRATIRPVFSTRQVIPTEAGFLVYSDHFTANNPRYLPRDGVYANDAYRFNPNRSFYDGMNYGPMYGSQRYPASSIGPVYWSQDGEYKFVSAHMTFLGRDGSIIWENAINLFNESTNVSGKYGEVSFDGEKLHYMYIDGEELKMSYIRDGEVKFENETFEIKLIDERERIKETQDHSLEISWWFDSYFLLSGKQQIRFLNEMGKEEVKEVFFLTKVKVDGDQFIPKD